MSACKSDGGLLASISSKEEEEFVFKEYFITTGPHPISCAQIDAFYLGPTDTITGKCCGIFILEQNDSNKHEAWPLDKYLVLSSRFLNHLVL